MLAIASCTFTDDGGRLLAPRGSPAILPVEPVRVFASTQVGNEQVEAFELPSLIPALLDARDSRKTLGNLLQVLQGAWLVHDKELAKA